MDSTLTSGELLLKRKKSKVPIIITYIVLVILIVFGFFYLLFGITTVDGKSMENTIYDDQQAFLLKHGYSIERGDIVTINVGTYTKPHELIKRIIAVSGDKILYVRDESNTYVNIYLCKSGETKFYQLDEPYIKEPMLLAAFNLKSTVMNYVDKQTIESIDITVQSSGEREAIRQKLISTAISIPQKKFYFLGDNRNVSNDSRNPRYGARKYSEISGKVLVLLEKGSAAYNFLNFLF